MKKIIFGRDHQTNQLRIVTENKSAKFGAVDNIPKSVGREHAQLTIGDDATLVIENIDIANDTFVNGRGVERKHIKKGDLIQFGKDKYQLTWDMINPFVPKFADIRPLKEVWEKYNEANIRIRLKQKNIGLLASVPMVFSMLGGVLSAIVPNDMKPYSLVLTVVALIIMAYGLYKRYTDNSIAEQEEVKKNFQKQYVCPECGHFMGNQDYEILAQGICCPHCKAQYRK